jgi:hypothetical protein
MFETQVHGLEPGDRNNMVSLPFFMCNQHKGGYHMLTTFLPFWFNVTITFISTTPQLPLFFI